MRAGTTVGIYTSIEEKGISEAEPSKECPTRHKADLPAHLTSLYAQAKKNCNSLAQEKRLRALIVQYQDVFSRRAGDMGRTTLVEHSIPVVEGT